MNNNKNNKIRHKYSSKKELSLQLIIISIGAELNKNKKAFKEKNICFKSI